MNFDLMTLMIAASFIAATGGAFLLFAWWNDRSARSMLWWAAANFSLAAGLPFLVMAASSDSPSMIFGIALLTLSPAFIWASARQSNERPVDPVFLLSGVTIWLASFLLVPLFHSGTVTQMAVSQSLVAFYLFASAREFSRERKDQISARHPLIVLLILHGLAFSYGVLASVHGIFVSNAHSLAVWLQLIHFETLVFLIGTSIFAVAMMREKSELRQKIKADTDELTDLHSRGAFFRLGEITLQNARDRFEVSAVVVFDLDDFKLINDTHGHALGDAVLRLFGRIALENLRSTDIIGRIGGEEFAAVLPDTGVMEASLIADRLRVAFAEASSSLELGDLQTTFSAGIVHSGRESSLGSLVGLADIALYQAKARGRNRVEAYTGPIVPVVATRQERPGTAVETPGDIETAA